MKNARMKYILLLACFFCFSIFSQPLKSIVFYYGNNPPLNELHAFDVAVVDPASNFNPTNYNESNHQAFAYVSIGEIDPHASYYSKASQSWIVGENKIWGSKVIDETNPNWQEFFINKVITPLWKEGYRGFFLDTLDSYQLFAKTSNDKKAQTDGLIKIIKSIKNKYPSAKLIFNRGFELLPKTHKLVYAVAAESLFKGWDQKNNTYFDVSNNEREYLLKKFSETKKYGLPTISIDYVAPKNRDETRKIAKKITSLGIIPYVTDGQLESLGVSTTEVIPRKLLVLYDGNESSDIIFSNAFAYAAMPLEYLGYVPIFIDVQKNNLPAEIMKGKYAGVVVWIESDFLSRNKQLQDWLINKMKNNLPIVYMGDINGGQEFQNAFNINISNNSTRAENSTIVKKSTIVGYEINPYFSELSYTPVQTKLGHPLIQIKDSRNNLSDMGAITPWGGYILNPFVLRFLPNYQARWVIDPIQFFRAALQDSNDIIPDITTENGRRIMISHVDGDGFANLTETLDRDFSAKVMLDEIFKKYKLPITVSIIQSEIESNGLFAKDAKELQEIAKDIFKLPWIEIASHSYSHPFIWPQKNKINTEDINKAEQFYLPVKNYKFNLDKEITESINYVDKFLAPKNKQCKVFLWTGDCNPDANAVYLTFKDKVGNMNGGNTTITKTNNSITNIAPLGIYRGKYFQVYAPNQNENIYTNLWSGPFYGYIRAVETFNLTDKPIRFKPVDVYYHFYSASKMASLNALKQVYDWALKQPFNNIYVSEYIKKVLDYNDFVVAKKNDGYEIYTNGNLKEIRVAKSLGYPSLIKSKNIIGFSAHNDSLYIHLGPEKIAFIVFQKTKPTLPYIENANGRITYFKRTNKGFDFEIKSYLPIKFVLGNMQLCKLKRGWFTKHGDDIGNYAKAYSFKTTAANSLQVLCKA